jgi:hypothetical protein
MLGQKNAQCSEEGSMEILDVCLLYTWLLPRMEVAFGSSSTEFQTFQRMFSKGPCPLNTLRGGKRGEGGVGEG